MPYSTDLSGRTAVVTGASSGIGRAVATRLGSCGAHVYLVGRSSAPMEDAAKEIEAAGGKAEVAPLDVRDADALTALVDRAASETGRLDVMVNNAGLSFPSSIVDGEPERWREMLEVNVLALLVGSQAAIRAMRRCGSGGHVVNVSSVAALRRDSGVYGATKHAVNVVTNTLRQELEDDDVRVVTVMPGAIATNFARNYDPKFLQGMARMAGVELEVEAGQKLPDEVLEKVHTQMQRTLGSPDDVAEAVLYAVTAPAHVNVSEIVVRPPKQLQF